jgi:hypothetical protein
MHCVYVRNFQIGLRRMHCMWYSESVIFVEKTESLQISRLFKVCTVTAKTLVLAQASGTLQFVCHSSECQTHGLRRKTVWCGWKASKTSYWNLKIEKLLLFVIFPKKKKKLLQRIRSTTRISLQQCSNMFSTICDLLFTKWNARACQFCC